MEATALERAVAAAKSVAGSLGLHADDAIVLNNSNKLALRLLPSDAMARVAPIAEQVSQFEIDLAQNLAASGSPVAALDPRVPPVVHQRDGFTVTLWTYYEGRGTVAPADYAEALERLHIGMRDVRIAAPHFIDRVNEARQILSDRECSPALPEPDRELLADTLRNLGREVAERGKDQLLHGEPHPGNLLATNHGPLFIDFETCCRGPIEFDLAHAPEPVADHYPGVDHDLLRQSRILMLAMIIAWRWDPGDQFPNGRRLAEEWTAQMKKLLNE
ncbi:aminoglycoside phosphotransferase family protein [Glycomyces luteolus]|uniref:Aminoglycoside phosphotransferase family protein n=1 Tax=Glycomyces luteolus TaxID=2670330 RepID=A0A9X3P9Q5_9ACTN|nr:aminoglycoside phosphotransferase family protein [Glycomyces luteolus]MDA1361386.1 aminoglycoside phosphotransferase family protein [Glycomyces luteolus]